MSDGDVADLVQPAQKRELWERWKQGQSISAISRALERRNKSGVQQIVARQGGIAPAPRRRAVTALRVEEREEISRGIAAVIQLSLIVPFPIYADLPASE